MPLSVIETPSGEIRLVPELEYGSKLEIISLLFQNVFFFLKGKGSKTISRAATTPRQLNENPSRAFCNLLNRNPVFLGRLSQPLFNPVPHYLCTLSPTVPLLEHSIFFAEVDGGNP